MTTIYKYDLPIQDQIVLNLPTLFKPLHVGEQFGTLCLWALVDPATASTPRCFHIVGTGHRLDSFYCYAANHIGTVLMKNGLVWHVFDMGPET